jgi:8-amino-7-oxononanoate synthase
VTKNDVGKQLKEDLHKSGLQTTTRTFLTQNTFIGNKSFIDFTSYDYFSLYHKSKSKDYFLESVQTHSIANSYVYSNYGVSQEHKNIEIELSRIFNKTHSLLFHSKNQASFSLLTFLLSENDLIIYDINTCAPVVDAAYLIGCQIKPVNLKDPNITTVLNDFIKSIDARKKIYLYYEEISGTDGHEVIADNFLLNISHLNIIPIIDVTYSMGYLSPNHSSTFNNIYKNCYFVGTFGFSVPGIGGFISGGAVLESLKASSNSLKNEPILPPAIAHYNLLNLLYLQEMIFISQKLKENILHFRGIISGSSKNFSINLNSISPIISLVFRDSISAKFAQKKLFDSGFLTSLSAYNDIKSELCILRLIINISSTEEQLIKVARILSEIR